MAEIFPWQSQAEYDEWLEQLCALIPDGDEAKYSNPEGAVESIILDCFTEYRRQLRSAAMSDDPVEQAIVAAQSVLPLDIGSDMRRHVVAAVVVGAIEDAGLLPTEVEREHYDMWGNLTRTPDATCRTIYRYVGRWREVSGDE